MPKSLQVLIATAQIIDESCSTYFRQHVAITSSAIPSTTSMHPQAYEESIYERLASEQFDRDLSLVFEGLSDTHQQVFLFMSGLAEG